MPRKTQPRDNWGHEAQQISYEKLEQREKTLTIPEQLGFELPTDLKRAYETCIILFIANRTQYANPPRAREVRAALERIQKTSKAFSDALHKIDAESERLLDLNGPPGNLVSMDPAEAIRLAETFNRAATLALVDVKEDKGGNHTDFALKSLVIKLAEIYEKATSKKPTISYSELKETSPSLFFELVNAIISTLGYSNI